MLELSQRKPVVGITTRFGDPDRVNRNAANYLSAAAQAGAIAVVLSPDAPARFPDGAVFEPDEQGRLPKAVLDHVDGLVLAGGGDVDPKYFGAELNGANEAGIDHKRDELELTLARDAMERDLPIFGICRGCQVLNVAAGGGMVQHFDGHRSPKENPRLHDVVLVNGTRTGTLIGQERLAVNTYHHQGMSADEMAPCFVTTGWADPDSWLVEAFESPSHRWLIGVQWHPERLFELPDAHLRLWQSFVDACCGVQAEGSVEERA